MVTDPSVYVRFPLLAAAPRAPARPSAAAPGAGARGRADGLPVSLLVWTTTPWTLISNVAAAVGADIQYARARLGDEHLILAADLVAAVLGPEAVVEETFPGSALVGRQLPAALRLRHARQAGLAGHRRRLRGHRRGHRHRAHRPGLRRRRHGRGPGQRPAGDHARGRGGPLHRRDHALGGDVRQGRRRRHHGRARVPRPALRAASPTSTTTRSAGAATRRSSTTPRSPGTCAPPPARTRCWPPTRRSPGIPTTSSTAASASGWRTTSTGRSPATATGARRCRSGAARTATTPSWARKAQLGELAGRDLSGLELHRPYVDEVTFACPECGAEARRVASVIDAWFDSGSMPVAQWHYPFENQETLREALPGRLHLRGHRPDPRLVLQPARHQRAAHRPHLLPQRALPGPHPGQRRPQDVQAPGQRGRSLEHPRQAGRRRAALVPVHGQLALVRRAASARRTWTRWCASSS